MRSNPEVVVVVVPAHDEEDRIQGCIQSIAYATESLPLGSRVELTVVLDDCCDRTGERAEAALSATRSNFTGSFSGRVTEVAHANVGLARAHGIETALGHLAGLDENAIWLASTDADTIVPANWLVHQLQARGHGYEAFAGTITVQSWVDQPLPVARLHTAHYRKGGGDRFGHRHVHGANLGFAAVAYRQVGGFEGLASGEDHALWRELRAAGCPSLSTPLAPVSTSGRREGRAPDGFASFLRGLTAVP